MTIKQRFFISYISIFAISIIALTAIVSMVFLATLKTIPTPSNFYKMLTVQRGLSAEESDAFLKLNHVLRRSPALLNTPFNEETAAIVREIEMKNLKVVIRKDAAFPYYTEGMVLPSLNAHVPAYEINNLERIGTLDNDGKLYRYVKSDFYYLDGSLGSFIVLSRETTLFEVFSRWGIGIVIFVLVAAAILADTINRKLRRSTIKPLETLEYAMQLAPHESNLNALLESFPQDKIAKDIQQLQIKFKEMWHELRALELLRAADESNRIALISNISHDLKTPITSIIGYVEGLLEGVANTPKKQMQYLRTVHQKAINLNDLIEALFLYSKLENQELTFDYKPLNIIDLMESVVDEYEASPIRITFLYDDPCVYISADAFQLRRVLVNLFENSLKFRDLKKEVATIKLTITHDTERVVISIVDNGKGIAQADLEHVFDRFYRADKSRVASIPGSGLGLGIVQQIVKKHQGTVAVQSVLNVKTEVIITLPRIRSL